MRFSTTLPFVAFAIGTGAEVATHPQYEVYTREALRASEQQVDTFELYSKYATTAYCNVDKQPGDPITCVANCGRAAEDGGIVLATYKGATTNYRAYMALVESRKQIIFIGRPLSTAEDVRLCLNYTTVETDLVDGGMVHGGFRLAWDEISEQVMQDLRDATESHPDYKVLAVGHSLGGAIAAMAAAHLRPAGYDVDMYSYGAPRIGNEAFSKFVSSQAGGANYRLTLREDPIPRQPPAVLGEFRPFGYRHISPEYWLTGEPADPSHWPVEDIKTCPGTLNWFCNSDWRNPPDFLFVDHGSYFGSMACMFDMPKGFVNGVYLPEEVQEIFRGWAVGESAAAAVDAANGELPGTEEAV